MEIVAQSVSHALSQGLIYLHDQGIPETSRNGDVLVAPEPVMTTYLNPTHRVLFSPLRDANPFFHLMEALWMLRGRNDIAFPKYFNQRFGEYSDDGLTSPAAYGYRWRTYFNFDQLPLIIEELKANPNSRRAVLNMWEPRDLVRLRKGTVDAPCNTACYFDARGGRLNMTVTCRSNDILWGAYGANAVHFSILLEYMAAWLGVPVGVYRQFSNNYHIYSSVVSREKMLEMSKECSKNSYYIDYPEDLFPLVSSSIESWDQDLKTFLDYWGQTERSVLHPIPFLPTFADSFFGTVAFPMLQAWMDRKKKLGTGMGWASSISDGAWRKACVEWILRRETKNV